MWYSWPVTKSILFWGLGFIKASMKVQRHTTTIITTSSGLSHIMKRHIEWKVTESETIAASYIIKNMHYDWKAHQVALKSWHSTLLFWRRLIFLCIKFSAFDCGIKNFLSYLWVTWRRSWIAGSVCWSIPI